MFEARNVVGNLNGARGSRAADGDTAFTLLLGFGSGLPFLLTGATLYPVATFDLDATMALIEHERITVLPGAPTIFTSLLNAPGRADRDLTSLRLAVTGAAVVPVVLIERMRTELAIDQVVTAFGMTEAVVVTMCREGDSAETVATTCGRAIPGMETRIGDEGELLVRGDYVMLGYLDDPEATAEAIDADGWLHTGDVGVLDDAGNLSITDRLKDMYISGGFNVYPAEVEQTLMRMEGVADVAVVGVPDERMGEVGKAYVVGAVSPEDVVAFARSFRVIGVVTPAQAIEERPDVVDAMHAAGLGVMVYTLNSTETWAQARALGVDGIITDKPSKLDRLLADTAPGT